ncbi:hypothetical protein K443DRAFT_14857 [Laccaria amethystina LaAM-08-1]|uniref:Uncharacterized protein n=1 Tax=Laccaria amethystina LaAM-08-1 TaxID=1095629 RepID=A0A0C9X2U7_9AGAR|nr:hypothetical protein K443DRAFT_14857 [Laccaria amethystina LaAM-08-1]
MTQALLAYPEALPERNLTQAQVLFKAEAQKGLHDVLGRVTNPVTMSLEFVVVA